MWQKWRREKRKSGPQNDELPAKDISITELKIAIREYSSQLPKGIPLSVLIEEDLRLNYQLLAPYLKAIPVKNYYMSKETYELFEEEDRELANEIDVIQIAVDKFIDQTGRLPITEDDPYRKVNMHMLKRNGLLSAEPKHTFYITDSEGLITHKRSQ